MKMLNQSKNQKVFLSALILAGQIFTYLPLPSMAEVMPVLVAGQQVLAVESAGNMTASARAGTIQRNIDNALVAATDHSPTAVNIVYVKGLPVLTLGGFYVATVDGATAAFAHTTPALLAQRWANALKGSLKDRNSVDSYIVQISGSNAAAEAGTTSTNAGSYPYYRQGRVVFIPAGMTIPVSMTSSATSETARAGDTVEARVSETVNLGDTSIAAGSVVIGKIIESMPGAKLGRSGLLGIRFTTLRTAGGGETPITAHIVGGIGQYGEIGSQTNLLKGESTENKVKQALARGAVGAGGGALLGTAIGAIAGHGRGAGRGAIAGTAIGGALGVAESLLLRKGGDVKVTSGQTLKLQLDAPASIAVSSPSNM